MEGSGVSYGIFVTLFCWGTFVDGWNWPPKVLFWSGASFSPLVLRTSDKLGSGTRLLIEPLWELRLCGVSAHVGNFVHMADVNPPPRCYFGVPDGGVSARSLRACAQNRCHAPCWVTRSLKFGSGSGAGFTDQSKFSGDLVDSAEMAGFRWECVERSCCLLGRRCCFGKLAWGNRRSAWYNAVR